MPIKIDFCIHCFQIVENIMVLRYIDKTPPVGVMAFWGGPYYLPRPYLEKYFGGGV